MSKPVDGGPAFPRAGCISMDHDHADMGDVGMSLRDHFAALAMSGWLASFGPDQGVKIGGLAQMAYEIADAMLVERSNAKP